MDCSLSEAERDLVGLCREFAGREIATRDEQRERWLRPLADGRALGPNGAPAAG